jgi:hypothetical protein
VQTAAPSTTALAPTTGSIVALNTPAPDLSLEAGLSFWVAPATASGNVTVSPTAAAVASPNINDGEPAFVSGALGLGGTASASEMTYTLASSPTNPAADEAPNGVLLDDLPNTNESTEGSSGAESLTDSCFIDPAWLTIRDESGAEGNAASDGGNE